jgi:hypothetical protein
MLAMDLELRRSHALEGFARGFKAHKVGLVGHAVKMPA